MSNDIERHRAATRPATRALSILAGLDRERPQALALLEGKDHSRHPRAAETIQVLDDALEVLTGCSGRIVAMAFIEWNKNNRNEFDPRCQPVIAACEEARSEVRPRKDF